MAGRDLPEGDRYDGYLQLENGVGMMRLLFDEFKEAREELGKYLLKHQGSRMKKRRISMATGRLAAPYIRELAKELEEELPDTRITVYDIRNDFFGEMITVAGLLTGQDIMAQLQDKDLGERLILPQCVLRSGEDVFLDDYRLCDLEKSLQVHIDIVKSSGWDFVEAIMGEKIYE